MPCHLSLSVAKCMAKHWKEQSSACQKDTLLSKKDYCIIIIFYQLDSKNSIYKQLISLRIIWFFTARPISSILFKLF